MQFNSALGPYKGGLCGGSRARRQVTGYSATYFAERMLATKGEGKQTVVSGSGNVAIYTIEKVIEFVGKVIACSDSGGYVVDENGIDLHLLKEIKEVRRERISEYARRKGTGCHYIEGGSVLDVSCEVAMPSATQNELTGKDAKRPASTRRSFASRTSRTLVVGNHASRRILPIAFPLANSSTSLSR